MHCIGRKRRLFSTLPGKCGDFSPFLYTEPSWAITPSERSESFIGYARGTCNELSVTETEEKGEVRNLNKDRSSIIAEPHSQVGGTSREFQKSKFPQHGRTNTEPDNHSATQRKGSRLYLGMRCKAFIEDKAFCAVDPLRCLSQGHGP